MLIFTSILTLQVIMFIFIFKLNRIAGLIITASAFCIIIFFLFFFTHYKVFIPLDINTTGKNENYKIDLVYLWCEDNPQRKKLRNKLKEKFGILENKNTNNLESLTESRFISNDELKYSLRSVEKYASWINKIYIITDNQIPKWLNLKHPKIKIVDHKEIMPESARPSFNSNAIEHCISNIKDLNEHFLYANDDMMFGNYVKPEDFFKNGKPIYILGRKIKISEKKSTYTRAIVNGYELFKKQFSDHRNIILDKLLLRYPHHNIDPYLKSTVKKTKEVFKNEIDTCINHLFRSNTDIERIIYTFYALANNEAYYKIKGTNIFNIKSIITKKNKRPISYYTNIHNGVRRKDSLIKNLNKYKMFCTNDNELTTEEDRKVYKDIMEQIFPDKSSFEK